MRVLINKRSINFNKFMILFDSVVRSDEFQLYHKEYDIRKIKKWVDNLPQVWGNMHRQTAKRWYLRLIPQNQTTLPSMMNAKSVSKAFGPAMRTGSSRQFQ